MTAALIGLAAFAVAGAVYLVAGLVRRRKANRVKRVPPTTFACFRCGKHPIDINALWCAACTEEVLAIDAADTRGLDEK